MSIDLTQLIQKLLRPEAFPIEIPADTAIESIQTHASMVFLTPKLVYKLKKPRDYGFFDYSTPALRRHFCEQEVLLNKRLAPRVYLGVAPVLQTSQGELRFGPTLQPGEVPEPGSLLAGCKVIDYAVVMERLPDEATLEERIWSDSVDSDALKRIADYLAAFHQATPTNAHIASYGSLEVIEGNWQENFDQMKPYIGRSIEAATYERIKHYIQRFIQQRKPLFQLRVQEERIRDTHGDLRLPHVYLLDHGRNAQAGSEIAILDCIEFNERFRYSDVASEVAFLKMELDGAGRSDLAEAFVAGYIEASGDQALRELVPFYSCYRACVRGKVTSFQLDGAEVPAEQRERARSEAYLFFEQAASYIEGSPAPTLLLIGGLMGTGKSTIAQRLREELGWTLFSSDKERKQLAQVDPDQPQGDEYGKGLYDATWNKRTYQALRERAKEGLASGRSVILDATFIRRQDRQMMAEVAHARGAQAIFLECVCPPAVVLERLAQRWQAKIQGGPQSGASRGSDGRPILYERQRKQWETFQQEAEPGVQHIELSTVEPLAITVEQALERLHIPCLHCPL